MIRPYNVPGHFIDRYSYLSRKPALETENTPPATAENISTTAAVVAEDTTTVVAKNVEIKKAPDVIQTPETKSTGTLANCIALPAVAALGLTVANNLGFGSVGESGSPYSNKYSLPSVPDYPPRLGPVNLNVDDDPTATYFINAASDAVSYATGQMWMDIGSGVSSVFQTVSNKFMTATNGSFPDTPEEISNIANEIFDPAGKYIVSINDTNKAAGLISIGVGTIPLVYGCNQLVDGLRDLIPVQYQVKNNKAEIWVESKFTEGADKISKGLLSMGVGALTVLGGANTISGKGLAENYYVDKAADFAAAVPNVIIDTCGAGLLAGGLIVGAVYTASTITAEFSLKNLSKAALAASLIGITALQAHAYLDN